MGVTTARLTIKNPFKLKSSQTAEFMVNSGAHYTVLPQEMVEAFGLMLDPFKREIYPSKLLLG